MTAEAPAKRWERPPERHVGRRPAATALITTGLTGLAVVGVTSVPSDADWVVYVLLAVPAAALWCLRRHLEPPFLSPVWIVVVTLGVVGALGYAFHERLVGLEGGGVIGLPVTDQLARDTAHLFALLGGAITVGAAAVLWRAPGARRLPASGSPIAFSGGARTAALWFNAVPISVFVIDLGDQLLTRPYHLATSAGPFLGAAAALSMGGVAVCGYLVAMEKGALRWAAASVAGCYTVLFFALSTRQLSLCPMLFAVGFVLGRPRAGRIVLPLGMVATVLLVPLPLFLRSLPSHGLGPYLRGMGTFSYADVDWLVSANNILISFPITAYAAFVRPPVPQQWLWTELNPLPGQIAGWYDIAPALRLNPYTPFSTVGTLGNYGPETVVIVGFCLGAVLAFLDRRVRSYIAAGRQFVAVGIVGMAALLAVTALQYNLRSAARLLLYTVAVETAVRLVQGHNAARRRRVEERRLVQGSPGG